MKAEDLGSIVTHDKALQFLLVHWEAAGLDVQISTARETQHVLTLSVPRHAVGIGLLKKQDNIGAACESIRAHVQFRLKLIGWGGAENIKRNRGMILTELICFTCSFVVILYGIFLFFSDPRPQNQS